MRIQSIAIAIAAVFMVSQASAFFAWDGAGDPAANGFTAGGGDPASIWSFDTPSAGFLKQNTGVGQSGNLKLTTASEELVYASGWSVEFGLEVISSPGHTSYAIFSSATDDAGGVLVRHSPTEVRISKPSESSHLDVAISPGPHVFRFSRPPGASYISVFIDGVLAHGVRGDDAAFGPSRLVFGDGTGGQDGEAIWDYLMTNGNTSTAITALGQAEEDAAAGSSALLSCESDLATCQADLAALATCASDLADCLADCTTCAELETGIVDAVCNVLAPCPATSPQALEDAVTALANSVLNNTNICDTDAATCLSTIIGNLPLK